MNGYANPGVLSCKFSFFDLIDIDTTQDINKQTRKHAYKFFMKWVLQPKL